MTCSGVRAGESKPNTPVALIPHTPDINTHNEPMDASDPKHANASHVDLEVGGCGLQQAQQEREEVQEMI